MVKSPTSAVFSVMAVVCTIGRPQMRSGPASAGLPWIYTPSAVRNRRISRQVVRVEDRGSWIKGTGVAGSWSSPEYGVGRRISAFSLCLDA